jgi:hypothetical protein
VEHLIRQVENSLVRKASYEIVGALTKGHGGCDRDFVGGDWSCLCSEKVVWKTRLVVNTHGLI